MANNSSWVADFNSLADSHGGGANPLASIGKIRGGSRKKDNAAEKLKAELKLLEWHKLANDAAIRAALMQTKSLKTQSVDSSPSHIADDAHWIRRVINNEQTKPLEVSRDFVVQHELKEKELSERQEYQTNHHLDVLKSLRGKLEDRAELRSRTAEFREWKKEFSSKKYAVLSGKTIEDFSRESRSGPSSQILGGSLSTAGANSMTLSGPAGGSSKVNRASELSTVLFSLEKLNELEKRITSLESDNAYDRLKGEETNNESEAAAKERLALEFRRKVKGDGAVHRAVYAVRERKKAWETKATGAASKGRAAGAGVNAARMRGATGGGTFLTDMAEDGARPQDREGQRLERLRQQHDATAGKKNLKVRVQTKKQQLKESSLSKKRHEDALAELKRRKADNHKKKPAQLPTIAKKGASAGIKTNNKHINDFQKLKQQNARKREKGGVPSKKSQSLPARRNAPAPTNNNHESRNRNANLPPLRGGDGTTITTAVPTKPRESKW